MQVAVTNDSSEEAYLGGVTMVGKDGTQIELESLVEVLNETSESNPDAYSATSSDLNSQASDAQISNLKPRAKGSQLYALRGIEVSHQDSPLANHGEAHRRRSDARRGRADAACPGVCPEEPRLKSLTIR